MSKKPDTTNTISQDDVMAEVMEFIKSKSIYKELQEEKKQVREWYNELDTLEQNLKDAKNELNQIHTQIATVKQQLEDKTLSLEMIQEICNTENQLAIKHRALGIHIKNLDDKISEHQQQYYSTIEPLTKNIYNMMYNYLNDKIKEIARPYINFAILCKERAHTHALDNDNYNIQLKIQGSKNYNDITTEVDKFLPVSDGWYSLPGVVR